MVTGSAPGRFHALDNISAERLLRIIDDRLGQQLPFDAAETPEQTGGPEIEPEQKESKSDAEKIIAALKTIANTARKDETPEYDPAQLIKSVAHTMSLIGSDDDLRAIIEG